MRDVWWVWFWLLTGVFYAISAIGGGVVWGFAALGCGWFAGRAAGNRP